MTGSKERIPGQRHDLNKCTLQVWRRALDAGATEFEALNDAFWGDRTGQFIDPFGHRWALDQHLRDVPHDEVERLAAEAFGGGAQS